MNEAVKRRTGLPEDAETKIVEAIADGAEPGKAVIAAGIDISPRNAEVLGRHLWTKHVDSNKSMVEAMEQVGISPVKIAQKLADKMDATQAIVVGKGENAYIEHVDDNSTQLKAVDMALKVVGGYAAKKTEHTELKFEEILLRIEDLD